MLKLNEKYKIIDILKKTGNFDSEDIIKSFNSYVFVSINSYWKENYKNEFKIWFHSEMNTPNYKPNFEYEIVYNEDIEKIIAIGKLQNA